MGFSFPDNLEMKNRIGWKPISNSLFIDNSTSLHGEEYSEKKNVELQKKEFRVQ